ncbi:protein of unknown function [Streptantibioticus cattleyicolor NRRL 8057 = DSM 46488]|nr:protein of unknown function [Streptantibioticus cattleyicolor NRRL 8057 = DSM 46488]
MVAVCESRGGVVPVARITRAEFDRAVFRISGGGAVQRPLPDRPVGFHPRDGPVADAAKSAPARRHRGTW